MKKALMLLVALVALAVPSVALAGDNNNAEATNSATVRGSGNQVGQQSAANNCRGGSTCTNRQTLNQTQRNFNNNRTVNRGVTRFGNGGGHFHGNGGGNVGVGGGGVSSVGGVGGGNVPLATTGADAWILALVGGVALAG